LLLGLSTRHVKDGAIALRAQMKDSFLVVCRAPRDTQLKTCTSRDWECHSCAVNKAEG
jgi:hypothetical protein